jgi:4-hydroxy-2-oxoheptanedioate aldolase
MMKENKLKQRLNSGEVLLGTWTVISSPTLIEIMGSAELDFVIIDHEHGPFSFEVSENMIRAAENSDCTPLIRVPENNPSYILRALEIGAHGILVPQIDDSMQAKLAIDSIYYSPLGNRGVSAFTRASGFNASEVKGRNVKVNKNILSILLVESAIAIENIEEILENSNIDIIYIGTYDLSHSLGTPDNIYSKEVMKTLEKTAKIIRQNNVACGVLAQSEKDIKNWVGMGFQFLPYIADCGIIHDAFTNRFKELREAVKA